MAVIGDFVDPRDTDTHTWCEYHCQLEAIHDDDFVCGECWHRYRGPDDVAAVNNEIWHESRTFDQIFSCPYCIHDF